MDLKIVTQAIQQIADEKGIPKQKIIETIELALAAAYKRDYGHRGQMVRARIDPETGKVTMTQVKLVVDVDMVRMEDAEEDISEGPEFRSRERAMGSADSAAEPGSEERKPRYNPERHLFLDEARLTKPDAAVEEELEFPLEPHDTFGRIAAQTAKQVIIQRIRETEREAIFNEYKDKEGELVSGMIQRLEHRNVFIEIGRTAGVLPPEEQVARERYRIGDRIKALILLVEKNPRGPGVYLSRSHPRLVNKLFEMEVPEIASGAVEIKAVAREAGSRSKVAVLSHEDGVDPVGSLVGQKGVRVSTVIHELGGEKIDVIEYAEDEAEFVANALSPARVLEVEVNSGERVARAIVAEDQLSLAIGKGGQNVRLAAKLTGWKIDVRSSAAQPDVSSQSEDEVKQDPDDNTSA